MRIICVFCVALVGLYLMACSSGATDGAKSAVVVPPAANSLASSNTEAGSTNTGEPIQNAVNRFDAVKNRRRPAGGATSESPARVDFRHGAENSETATTMNDRGQPVEVRVFRDNAQLDRVEAVWLGPSEKLLRITLRSGGTVEVKTDRVANLASASSDLLIELAGGPK